MERPVSWHELGKVFSWDSSGEPPYMLRGPYALAFLSNKELNHETREGVMAFIVGYMILEARVLDNRETDPFRLKEPIDQAIAVSKFALAVQQIFNLNNLIFLQSYLLLQDKIRST